jgi:hypothetical protein
VSAPASRNGADPDERAVERWRRLLSKNARWVRTQGVGRLIEEHELHPVQWTAAAVRRARWRRREGVTPGEGLPVFLVGLQRSGTNMVVRGLETLPEFEVHNEGDRRAFSRYRLRPDPVIREIVLASRHRFVLFKPLCETHRIVELLDGLGTPRRPLALWAYRDVDGRVRSAAAKFGSTASDALRAVAEGRGGHLWQGEGLSEDSLGLIASVDWDEATAADGIALLWYVRNRLYFERGVDTRADVLLVPYGDLVRTPEPTMRAVCRFLGVRWSPAVAAHIDGRSLGRKPPVVLHPEIRSRCDALLVELDEAARPRLAASSPA